MIKNKKLIAMMIAFLMIFSNFTGIFSNISFAVKENVTVVISADSDSNLTLSDGVMNEQGQLERRSINIYLCR